MTDKAPIDRPSSFPWPPVLFAAAILAAPILDLVAPLAWPGFTGITGNMIGVGAVLSGVAIFAWARNALLGARTTIDPTAAASVIVSSGPYRFVRNPIYVAFVIILLGLGQLTANLWFVGSAVLLVPLLHWLAILPEERHLEAKFGPAWRTYASRVRRWL